MKLPLDRRAREPLYLQIAAKLREQIASGALPEGHRLPPERSLARSLGVNRSTVYTAYAELKADGLLGAHVGRGTVVLPGAFQARRAGRPLEPLSYRELARRGSAEEPLPIIRDLLELASQKRILPLSVGLPDPALLPLETVRELQARLLEERGAELLLHSPTEGIAPLRESLAQLSRARGIACAPDEILVTSGSQQGLDLIRRVLLDPGDAVVVEQPSFFGALEVFRAAEARILTVPVDGEGMRVDRLEELLDRFRPKLIYTLPTFQNPSGTTLSLERRRRLLELAYRHRVPILEDDLYYDLRYEGASVPPLRALDAHGYVLYLSSVSKVLFPGLRVGWLIAPRPFLRTLALAKQATDLHSSTFGQFLLDAFLREGHYAPHLERVRKAYARKCRALCAALRRHRPAGLSFLKPEGGFYLWCQLPGELSSASLLARAARERVSFLPGEVCLAGEASSRHLRLNFSHPSVRELEVGVERLARALGAARAGRGAASSGASETAPII